MAIDTAEKRRTVSGIPFLLVGVTPNASKDAKWRKQAGWTYYIYPILKIVKINGIFVKKYNGVP